MRIIIVEAEDIESDLIGIDIESIGIVPIDMPLFIDAPRPPQAIIVESVSAEA